MRNILLLLFAPFVAGLTTFDCDYKETVWNDRICLLEHVLIDETFADNLTFATKNQTESQSSQLQSQYTRIVFESCSLYFIPPEIFSILKNLNSFVANDVGLQLLQNETFQNAENLRILELAFNKLESIDLSVFEHLLDLEQLNLLGNPIQYINPTIFITLTKLKFADFRWMTCASDSLVIHPGNYSLVKTKLQSCFGDDLDVFYQDYDDINNSTELNDTIENIPEEPTPELIQQISLIEELKLLLEDNQVLGIVCLVGSMLIFIVLILFCVAFCRLCTNTSHQQNKI